METSSGLILNWLFILTYISTFDELIRFTRKELKISTFLGTFGIWSLMAALSLGANGDTYTQIYRSCLLMEDINKFNTQYENLTSTIFKTDIAGVRVLNKNFLLADIATSSESPDFKKMLASYYNTVSLYINFHDKNTPSYVNDRIKAALTPVTSIFDPSDFKDTALMMSNVLFFEGNWSIPFDASNTRKETTTDSKGENVVMDMMQFRGKVPYSHIEAMRASAIELPFGNDGQYCMLLLVPLPGVEADDVLKNLEKFTFRDIFAKLPKSGTQEVTIKLPKFVQISSVQLQKPLKAMGIYDAFDPDNSDFSKMSKESIYIGTIEQKAAITFTETGVVAIATIPGYTEAKFESKESKAVPLFIFFIMEKPTATVLFGGIF